MVTTPDVNKRPDKLNILVHIDSFSYQPTFLLVKSRLRWRDKKKWCNSKALSAKADIIAEQNWFDDDADGEVFVEGWWEIPERGVNRHSCVNKRRQILAP